MSEVFSGSGHLKVLAEPGVRKKGFGKVRHTSLTINNGTPVIFPVKRYSICNVLLIAATDSFISV